MKRKWLAAPAMILAALLTLFLAHAGAEPAEEAAWTVMFYMCGSDLESKYSFATSNLEEISKCHIPVYQQGTGAAGPASTGMETADDEKVNILIQTGGSEQWHAQELGLEIRADRLQRWRFEPAPFEEDGKFYQEEELPLASMADPDTLSDFIRWGKETYPARKYLLVLWDHGAGSKTGIFIDELYEGDIMYLDELHDALQNGGIQMEAVLLDACLMANLETGYQIRDSAHWMIASEEVVAGKGTAINGWLQQLLYDPQCDGEMLGRWVCDMTQIKYGQEGDEQALDLLTWSVIDLTRIGRVAEIFDHFFARICEIYVDDPAMMSIYAREMLSAEDYGTGVENMFDLSDVLYRTGMSRYMNPVVRREMINALKETIVYSVRGSGRSTARGLSFCYAVDFGIAEMETYSRNCPSLHYLAFLDAISPWTAPDEIYQQVARLPEMSTMDCYRVTAQKIMLEDQTPAICFAEGTYLGANVVQFGMARLDERTGQYLSLGLMPAYYDETIGERGVYRTVEPWDWPSIEGEPCASQVVGHVKPGDYYYLGSIPIQIGTDIWYLRYAYFGERDEYKVYGLWEGYDSDSNMFNRNVKSLAQLAGREYSLLYPLYESGYDDHPRFTAGEPKKMYRSLEIRNEALKPGKYYLQYIIYDMFRRPMPMEIIEIDWDGEDSEGNAGFTWEGEIELTIPEEYWQ